MKTRRSFCQAGGLTALAASRVMGANGRVRVGGLGTGGRGTYVLRLAKEFGNVDIVALADINKVRLDSARQQLAVPGATLLDDFQAVLDRKDVDAVVIGSPDHWHVPMLTAAVGAGKDAYCEKPLTHTVEEGDAIKKTVEASDRIVQVGYQQRSYPHFQEARRLIEAGRIGKVTLVHSYWQQNAQRSGVTTVDPSQIEWKKFLGSAPPRAFDPWRYSQWRFFWDYGGGTMTDLYSHWIDAIHWIMDDWAPLTAQGTGSRYIIPHWECPDTVTAAFRYPKNWMSTYTSTMVTRVGDGGMVFRGTMGSLALTRNGFALRTDASSLEQKTNDPTPDLTAKSQRDGTIDHVLNWLDCLKTRKRPNAPVAEAVMAANAAHWGNEAIRSGKLIELPRRETDFHPLFDGRSLNGWVVDTPGVWAARDGMLTGSSPGGLKWNDFLRTAGAYQDFELKLEFRLVNGAGNSGVQFRSEPVAGSHEVSGYQADVGARYWGALYDESRRNKVLVQPDPAMLEKLDRSGWHEYTIRAYGNHITLTLDGVRTVDYTEPDAGLLKRGFIALQMHAGPPTEVQFKNIRIREL
ncbi:MAG: DUF1080 domain-containing protein [Bryobacterales bacterium]|nr:DUF1080 domain-containing protein [Bryobacterales bacterium]